MKFHEKIVHFRKQKGWSQADLGKRIGIHVGHISRIEHGKATTSVDVLRKIAAAFEVPTDYLLDESADEFGPVKIENKPLAERLQMLDQLDAGDKATVINVIDSMLTKKKMLDLLTKREAVSA